jgi:hypothetical protein
VAPELGPLTRTLIGIARHVRDDHRVAAHICRAYVECLDVDGAAISLLTATTSRETLSATDATAATLEELQFTLGEGACVQAALSGRPVLASNLHDHALTTRWPMFAAAVAEQTGVQALFALPLQLGAINLGVLDLYRNTPGPLCGDELRDAVAAADTATLMLLAMPVRTDDAHTDEQPTDTHAAEAAAQHRNGGRPNPDAWKASAGDGPWCDGSWNNHAEVHQATGMILVQLGVPAQDAFVRLRAHAFATHRRLADVASDVVARRLVFTQEMD